MIISKASTLLPSAQFPSVRLVRFNGVPLRYRTFARSDGNDTARLMRIRLTRKLADVIDGIDLSRRRQGDVLELTPEQARILIAEGWASPVEKRAKDRPRQPQKPKHR